MFTTLPKQFLGISLYFHQIEKKNYLFLPLSFESERKGFAETRHYNAQNHICDVIAETSDHYISITLYGLVFMNFYSFPSKN